MGSENQHMTDVQLSGLEKAAALLLIMGKESASKLATYFSSDEIQKLSSTVGKFDSLNPDTVNSVVSEFQDNYLSMGILAKPDSIASIFEDVQQEDGSDDALPSLDGETDNAPAESAKLEQIKEYIASEPPYIAAFFLSTLDDERSAKILETLDEETRKTLFKLLLDRKQPQPYFEKRMRSELLHVIVERSDNGESNEKIESAAGLMNFLAEETGEGLMKFLQAENPEAAEILKKSVFKFSDLVKLAKPDRALVFDRIESDDVTRALGNANDELKECVLDCLSQRNRRMVESELARGPASEDLILTSQRKISGVVVSLSREGKLSLPDASG